MENIKTGKTVVLVAPCPRHPKAIARWLPHDKWSPQEQSGQYYCSVCGAGLGRGTNVSIEVAERRFSDRQFR